ncbi:MAG: hypothetical protein C4341_01865 [Armatimonadota bacterium]
MSDLFKFGIGVLLVIVAFSVLVAVVKTLLGLVIPLAVLAGILYVLYQVFGKKALGGGRIRLP